jgi:RNA polymerase sigma-70 factor (ECF subfamily)
MRMSLESGTGLFGALDEHRAELRRFLAARSGSEADADDLLSELWIKVQGSQSGPISNPKSYLFRMANNLVLDRVREARRRERREADWTYEQHGGHSSEVADPSSDTERMLIEQGDLRQLADAIAQLPSGAQCVLRMHKLEGLSHGEVAERLGISKSAVEKHMAVAMTHLRRLLATEAPDDPRRLASNKGGPATMGTGLKS